MVCNIFGIAEGQGNFMILDRIVHFIIDIAYKATKSQPVSQSASQRKKNLCSFLNGCNKFFSNSHAPIYQFKKNNLSKEEWDKLMLSIENANLEQSWDYAEALSKIGWGIERYLIYYNETIIGFFQIFKKRYFFLRYIRLERGPLFLDDSYKVNHAIPILIKIRARWNFWKAHLLLIKPELPFQTVYYDSLCSMGFRLATKSRWESSKVNLLQNEEKLLQNMKANWRNSLKRSMKHLELKKTTQRADLDWLLDQYEKFKIQKKIIGVARELIEVLYEQMIGSGTIHILIAKYKDVPASGIIIVTHGKSCSYLLGWNGEIGRKFNAHNFLLWYAINEAKLRGEILFDLGGILSDKRYKQLSEFKSGLNGKKYALVGTFY
ncbi:TPA: GNAT family N-acetyltransferase [Legionella pneumophila]|nr:GNAT family N-acetyltransferase [Legionella pneumophila]